MDVLKILSLNSIKFCQGNEDGQLQIVTNHSIFHKVFCMKAKIDNAKNQTVKVNGLLSVKGDAKFQLCPLAFISLMGSFMLKIRYKNKKFLFQSNFFACSLNTYRSTHQSSTYSLSKGLSRRVGNNTIKTQTTC